MLKTIVRRILPRWVKEQLRELRTPGEIFPSVIPYEPAVQRAMKDHICHGDVVFDVGAHVGMHSVAMGRLVGPDGRVYCFEANPKLLGRLQKNLKANRMLERCTVVHGAVAEEHGTKMPLFTDGRPWSGRQDSTIMRHLAVSSRMGENIRKVQVPTISLDEYCVNQRASIPSSSRLMLRERSFWSSKASKTS